MLTDRSVWLAVLGLVLLQTAPLFARSGDGASDWLPEGVTAEAVGGELRINGLATRVLRLRGAVDTLQLGAAFKNVASAAIPAAPLDGWELLARQFGRGFQTLQMRSDGQGGVEALLATTDLSIKPRISAATPLRLTGAAQLTNVVESGDAATAATQYVAWSPLPAAALRKLLCERATSDGWQVASCDKPVVDMSRPSRSVAMSVVGIPAAAQGMTRMRAIVVLNELRSAR